MDALLRSHIQFQGEVASFIFAGSEPVLMRGSSRPEWPLYGRPCRCVRPLDDGDIARYVAARFRETGAQRGRGAEPSHRVRPGSLQRAMLLAHRLRRRWSRRGRRRSRPGRSASHPAALAELQPEFDANWRRLTTNEQKALRAVIAGEDLPTGCNVLEQLDLPKSTARASLGLLAANATIERRGGGLRPRRPALRTVDPGAARRGRDASGDRLKRVAIHLQSTGGAFGRPRRRSRAGRIGDGDAPRTRRRARVARRTGTLPARQALRRWSHRPGAAAGALRHHTRCRARRRHVRAALAPPAELPPVQRRAADRHDAAAAARRLPRAAGGREAGGAQDGAGWRTSRSARPV